MLNLIIGFLIGWVLFGVVVNVLNSERKIDVYADESFWFIICPWLFIARVVLLIKDALYELKYLDICIKNKLNPFHTSLKELKSLSREDREKIVNRIISKKTREKARKNLLDIDN